MRRPINTVNGTYKDPNLSYSAQDALNVIPMMTEKSGTRTVSQYRQAPGLKPFCRIGTNDGETVTHAGAGRGLRVVDNKLFAVAGRNLWQITASGVSVNYGTIPGVGRVSMAHNQRGLGNELAIDNGQSRYVFNTQTQDLQKVTDEAFPGSFKAVFIDGYIVYVEPQGRYFGHSDLSNALSYNSFDEYEAEGQPDRVVTAHESNRELLIFGQETTEAYVNSPSGSGEAPFVRATNTVIKSGCSARDSVCDVGLYTVYLDHNRTVQVLNGYTPVPISTAVIDSALQSCTKQQIANAYAFALESEGFQIYYLTVPGKFTFGYDFKNKEWHRRSSTGLDWWAVTDVVQWNGRWYALDSRRGDILELRWYDYPFDVQEELVREWVTGTISADQNPIFVHELELLFGCGGQEYSAVDFPDQPVGPSITGAAPDGFTGDPYSFSYTTTPGDSPVARTVIRDETTVLVGGEPSTLAAAGFTWNQSTATISSANVASNVVVSLSIRVYDTAGLYADHTDEFIVVQEVALLVTGSEKTLSGPLFARASALSDLTFEGILTSTGADISDATATFADELFVAVSSAGARYAADSSGSWTTGTVGSFPGGSPNFGKIVGSPAGYLAVIPEDSSNPTAFIAPSPPTAFTRTTLLATNTEGNPTTDVQKATNVLFVNDWYVLCYSRSFFQSSVPEGPYVAVWDEFKEIDSGRNPNADSIVAWYDFAFFNDAWYAIISWDFELSTRKTQLIRSENGITDWSVFTVLVDIGYADAEAPIQLCAGGDRLVCYNSDGTLRTDADDFATLIETGLSGPGINHLRDGRKIVYTGALFYCIGSSDTCVTFNPITLEVGELTTMPINSAVSISCNFVEAA